MGLFLVRSALDDSRIRSGLLLILLTFGALASSRALGVALDAVLPSGSLASWVALVLAALGVAATVVSEFPPFVRVLRGGPLPRDAAYVSDEEAAAS